MPAAIVLLKFSNIPQRNGSIDASGDINLTEVGDLDWMHFGSDVDVVQKKDGNILGNVLFGNSFKFADYKARISYNDGLEQQSISGSTSGTCSTVDINLTLNISPSVKKVILYTGAWKATNKIEVYSSNGKLLASSTEFTAGSSSLNKVVTFSIDAAENSVITIKVTIEQNSPGNVFLQIRIQRRFPMYLVLEILPMRGILPIKKMNG